MTRGEHIERHKMLHKHLDELMADYIYHTENLPSQTSVMTFAKWVFEQTKNPTEKEREEDESSGK